MKVRREFLQTAPRAFGLSTKADARVLGYAQISVPEFVDRVESRSSLLMLSGHDIERERYIRCMNLGTSLFRSI
jgi:hypothetical protein